MDHGVESVWKHQVGMLAAPHRLGFFWVTAAADHSEPTSTRTDRVASVERHDLLVLDQIR